MLTVSRISALPLHPRSFDQVAWVPAVVQDFRLSRGSGAAWSTHSSNGEGLRKGNRTLALQSRGKKQTPSWVPTRKLSRFFGLPVLDINPEAAYVLTDNAFLNTNEDRRKFLDGLHEGQRVAVKIAFRQVRKPCSARVPCRPQSAFVSKAREICDRHEIFAPCTRMR
jgi:hypothetical protein